MTAASEDPKPEPPQAPLPSDCCQSGCDPCVYDLYWRELERYEEALRAWEGRVKAPKDGGVVP
jgi:hypothetical protein